MGELYVKSKWKLNPQVGISEALKYVKTYQNHALADSLLIPISDAYFEMGNFSQAEKEWKIALAGRPVDIPMHLVNLGMVYFQSEKYENAIQAWQKADELRPGDPNLYFNIALAYFKNGQYKEADHELTECLRLQPDSQNARMLAEKIKSLKGEPFDSSR